MNKHSKQREAILRVLRSTTSHPSAEWIYERVKKEIPNIGLATVYRNLRLLEKMGEISELAKSNDTTHFDGNSSSHYHFRCDRCGKILDIFEPWDSEIESKIAGKTGLKVTRHYLEFGGLCVACQNLEDK